MTTPARDPRKLTDDELDRLIIIHDEAAQLACDIPGEREGQEVITLSALLRIERRQRQARRAALRALDEWGHVTQ
ncbi:hypothetical protein GCM10009854_27820 [Saccharopolyspora halophila]|uniref:Uncharacterized protein n=1 Tax=Saccharopolyspora halophila TaxID=405551 RepID=A0ABN3GCU7_9PSEU